MGVEAGCVLCGRRCGARRPAEAGYCGASAGVEVAAVCLHTGEEPPISGPRGIVNVFFAHCGLQCIYCQNRAVSGREVKEDLVRYRTIEAVADEVCRLLPQSSGLLGLVTAAQYADQVPLLLAEVQRRGFYPTVVYNSGGYENVDTLQRLEGMVDVYLPDFKYADSALAAAYSHSPDYPEVALATLREMRRQVGGGLKVDDGMAYRGLVVRHLVLPGAVDNSLRCLDRLADEVPFGLHLSLMAQYYPPFEGLPAPLDRPLHADEYEAVVAHAEALGLTDGWTQELQAQQNYRPDFLRPNPFMP